MNKLTIAEVIKNYNKLSELVQLKLTAISEIDSYYSFSNVSQLTIDDNENILIHYIVKFWGNWDTGVFTIPMEWLILDNDTLKKEVLNRRKERIEENKYSIENLKKTIAQEEAWFKNNEK